MSPLPIVLITGASSGIGRELARLFAADQYELILIARDRTRLEAVAAELHQKYRVPIRVEVCDLGDAAALERLISNFESGRQRVDVLVNNAGFGVEGSFAFTEWKSEKSMLDVNVLALVRLTKAFLPQMLARRTGKILQVASVAAFCPGPYLSLYFASKAFVLSFSEALSSEVREFGVTITTLCPGPTETGFLARLGTGSNIFKGLRLATPEQVAALGFRAVMEGRRVTIHGLGYRILIALVGWVPRFVPLAILSWILKKKVRLGALKSKNFPTL